MSSNTHNVTNSTERLIGRVKWFNNKAGYGFITVTEGTQTGSDIFVHHTSINVENQQYKYLMQGEYVEFSLSKTTSGVHEYQASNVNGIKCGKLMCETRREFKLARNLYKSEKRDVLPDDSTDMPMQLKTPSSPVTPKETIDSRSQRPPRETRTARVRGEGPREENKKEWTLISKNSENKGKTTRGRPPRKQNTVNASV
jgi:cold shock CspA family protein